ncbi:carbon storage regulator [Ralstonia phage RPZH3]|nr:carbon storage regulator [Ralstonia phage RPZH3]
MGTLRIDLKPGESIAIGDYAVVTLEEKSGKLARLAIEADRAVPIRRATAASPAKIAASVGITGKA